MVLDFSLIESEQLGKDPIEKVDRVYSFREIINPFLEGSNTYEEVYSRINEETEDLSKDLSKLEKKDKVRLNLLFELKDLIYANYINKID